jgi:plasmid stabilization system protein ParE
VNIRWSESAAEQLESIFEYIGLDSVDAAILTIQRIHAAIDRLAQMPYLGRKGQNDETRELVVPGTPYLVVYAIQEEIIYLIAIFHGAQKRS